MLSAKKELFTPSGGGYQISRSVRLRSSASASLNRTFVAGDTKTWTWSAWVKRGTMGAINQYLFALGSSQTYIIFNSDNIQVGFYSTNAATLYYTTTSQVFRDPSAWYHIVVAIDTTQATAANRNKLYVNGVQVTAFSAATYPSQNDVGQINTAAVHRIGSYDGSSNLFDGYLTEINFVNAQQLTPSSFGETNAVTGVWQPKKYAGTYGTNGFYLNFSDNSGATATTLGKDNSGNGNNWTPNNISVTAGATYDSMLDVPTPYDDGGNGRGNYAVMNPLQLPTAASTVLSNANLLLTCNSGTSFNSFSNGTMYPTSGKYYAEFFINTVGECYVGISRFTNASTPNSWNSQSTYYNRGGVIQKDNSTVFSVATYTTGDTIGVAYDVDNATCAFYKNNTLVGTVTGVTSGSYTFSIAGYLSCAVSFNTGQRPFTYTPPTGFKALNTQSLPDAPIKKGNAYFDVSLWTGDATTPRAVVSNLSFSPDLVWTKDRSVGYQHSLQDTVRGTGASKKLYSSLTEAENGANSIYGHINSFDANGFTVATGSGGAQHVNASGVTYVGWQWNAGGSTVTNTDGTISAQVRANTTAGFSVVTYTGTGAAATVGHGLGVAPAMMIIKTRSAVNSWVVYHQSLGNTKAIYLNLTGAADTNASFWNNTTPTSSVLTVNTDTICNQNGTTYVAYCFAAVAGYSAFGSYTGNGSTDGPFVFTGFRPRFVLIKRSDSTGNWFIWDSSRNTYNAVNNQIYPDSSSAEAVQDGLDFLSNGFKIRFSSTFADRNANGGTYIYAAFAEVPFKYSLGR